VQHIQNAFENNDIDTLLTYLEDKTLPIEHVEVIYNHYRNNKTIVSQTAMNLSLRTSVHNRSLEYSETIVRLLVDIAKNPVDMGARWAVAKNPHTPTGTLSMLAKDKINLVRALVAANPSTPSNILETLFNDEKIVRDGLSGNPNTPSRLLKILSKDNDKMVRMRLAENRTAPKDIITLLLKDIDSNVAKAAEINLKERT
jgi:hypothetical protein